MKKFEYTIKDEMGIHARPAGMLAKEGRTVEASKLMALMSLAVKCGQTVEVQIEGSDEEAAYEVMKSFFEANL